LGFIWLLVAGCRVLYRNYKYGDASLKTINAFLLAMFVSRIIMFFAIFGALNSDMLMFCGLLGLSVSLNGGVARPTEVVKQAEPTPQWTPPPFLRSVRAPSDE
jgi:hypothetical protein